MFSSTFFLYVMYCFILFLLYYFTCMYLFWYIIFYITQSRFFIENLLFFMLSKNYNISLYRLKYVHFILFYIPMTFLRGIFYSYIITLFFTLHHYHWHFILLHYTQSCFCSNCQCTFSSSQGLSIYCYTYNNDNNYLVKPRNSTILK